MSRKVGNTFYIEAEAPSTCELCGKIDELRPYGPKGERICFDCGMKNRATTAQRFSEAVDGPGDKSH